MLRGAIVSLVKATSLHHERARTMPVLLYGNEMVVGRGKNLGLEMYRRTNLEVFKVNR